MPLTLVADYLAVKSLATRPTQQTTFTMTKRPRTETTLARNLAYLLRKAGWSEAELSRRSGVAQKTVNNAMHGVYQTKVESVELMAKPFGLQGWNLIHPNMIRDIESGTSVAKLLQAFSESSDEGKTLILSLAEREAKYGKK